MVSIHSPFIFPFFHILFKAKTREDGIRYISNANIFMDFKSLHAPKILVKIVYYYLQHRLHVHEIWNNLWTSQTDMPHKIYLSIIICNTDYMSTKYEIIYGLCKQACLIKYIYLSLPIESCARFFDYRLDSYFWIIYDRTISKVHKNLIKISSGYNIFQRVVWVWINNHVFR